MSKQKKEYKYMDEPGGRDRLPHKKRDYATNRRKRNDEARKSLSESS